MCTHLNMLDRAEELERDNSNPETKYIAYYCLLFAVEKGFISVKFYSLCVGLL